MITVGTRVVVVHPGTHRPAWGVVEEILGNTARVYFQLLREPYTTAEVPLALMLAPVLPEKYENDGVGAFYWRKDKEIEAELLAFRADHANDGKAFWPVTFVD